MINGLQATEQALLDERAAGRHAFVMAAAAHAYCAEVQRPMESRSGLLERELHRNLLAAHDATTPSPHQTHVVVAVEELERLKDVEQHFRDRWRHAQEAAARIDTAFSHGVPSGSNDPVTAEDWLIVLNHARSGGA